MCKIMIVLLTLMLPLMSKASDIQGLQAEAAKAYDTGRYEEAIETWNKIANTYGVSSELLTDMGNAYVRSGDFGHGALCYMRALRLAPGNRQAQNNLEYINEKTADANKAELKGRKYTVVADTDPFLTRLGIKLTRDTRSDTWAGWAAGSFLLLIACVALYIFSRVVALRKTGFFAGIGFLSLTVIFLSLSFAAARYSDDRAVVTIPKAYLRTDPSDASTQMPVALTRGTLLRVTDTWPDAHPDAPTEVASHRPTGHKWIKVRLNSDFSGWLPLTEAETVDL